MLVNCTYFDIPSWSSALFLPKSRIACPRPTPRTALVPPGPLVELAGVSMGSMLAWESGSLLRAQLGAEGWRPSSKPRSGPVHPACHSGSFLGLKPEGACRQFEGWRMPQACPGPGGSLWQWAWSISGWASAWDVEEEKCYKQTWGDQSSPRSQRGSRTVGAMLGLRGTGGRTSLLPAVSWPQGTLDAHTAQTELLRGHPQGCCYGHRCPRSCVCMVVTKATSRETLLEFW